MSRRHSSATPAHRTRDDNGHSWGSSHGAKKPTAVTTCEHRNDSFDTAVMYICIFLSSEKSTQSWSGETRKWDVVSACSLSVKTVTSYFSLLSRFGQIKEANCYSELQWLLSFMRNKGDFQFLRNIFISVPPQWKSSLVRLIFKDSRKHTHTHTHDRISWTSDRHLQRQFLTQHTRKKDRRISVLSAGFEPTITAIEHSHTCALTFQSARNITGTIKSIKDGKGM